MSMYSTTCGRFTVPSFEFVDMFSVESVVPTRQQRSMPIASILSTRMSKPAGLFIDQIPKFYYSSSKPRNKPHFDVSGQKVLPPVDILYGHQESNSHLIRASIEPGAKGIIFTGVGAGGWSIYGLKNAQSLYNQTRIPMIFSRRINDGFAGGDSIYSFQMTSGFLNPQKSRIMLQLALNVGSTNDEIWKFFNVSEWGLGYGHT